MHVSVNKAATKFEFAGGSTQWIFLNTRNSSKWCTAFWTAKTHYVVVNTVVQIRFVTTRVRGINQDISSLHVIM